jgi:hypothetical protein
MNPEEPVGKRFRGNTSEGQASSSDNRKDEDDGFQPSMMSFKAFLAEQRYSNR